MYHFAALSLIALLFQQASPIETRIVEYLKANVTPGKPVVVSELYNNVFKTPEEQKVLERLYNTFFKIPMFIVQYNTSTQENSDAARKSPNNSISLFLAKRMSSCESWKPIRACRSSSSAIPKRARSRESTSRRSKLVHNSAASSNGPSRV